MNELFTEDIVFSAYKKLKHYFYYDNTSLLIRQRIAEFETKILTGNELSELKNRLYSTILPIFNLKLDEHKVYLDSNDKIGLAHIDYHLLPKVFKKRSLGYISNKRHDEELHLKRINIFINGSVEIHLISVLWLMYAGKYLNKEIRDNNYAYKLQINEDDQDEKIVDGLRLYKPYFLQYQKWRDNAISKAEDLFKDKKDVTILSLDVKDYFHTVEMDINEVKKSIEDIIDKKIEKSFSDIEKGRYYNDKKRVGILCDLLNSIHEIYSQKISKVKSNLKNRNTGLPLPIGLMSSGLLGNYYLRKFDEDIIEQLNPAYYGRYVDDLMFVFPNVKVDADALSTINNFLDRYFIKRGLLRYVEPAHEEANLLFTEVLNEDGLAIKKYYKNEKDLKTPKRSKEFINWRDYLALLANQVQYAIEGYPRMIIQSEKVILHHFNHKESKATLNKFKKRLEDQRSEFRFLPDEDKLTSDFDEEAFSLQYNDSINKFRSIQELSEDKYGASKFLAQKIFARNYGDDEIDDETDAQILTFFKGFVGLSFYSLWEKVATYFVITNRPDNIIKFKRHILRSIHNIRFTEMDKDELNVQLIKGKIQKDLEIFLITSIAIPLALNPSIKFDYNGEDEKIFFEACRNRAYEIRKSNLFRQALTHIPAVNYTTYTTLNSWSVNLLEFDQDIIKHTKRNEADNVNLDEEKENVQSIPHIIINEQILNESGNTNQAKFDLEDKQINSILLLNKRLAALSPRYVYFHEINIKKIYEVVILIDENVALFKKDKIKNEDSNISDHNKSNQKKAESECDLINAIPDNAFEEYWVINYDWRIHRKTSESLKKKYFDISNNRHCEGTNEYYVDIKGRDKNKTVDKRIAIANIKVEQSNILKSINEKPNLSRNRRKELFSLLNQADKEKCDLFVLPEVSVPFSWIKLLAYRSHKRNVGIVAGLEHWINSSGIAFNFMITVLPIKLDDYTTSIIKLRLKNHYAHDEKELLRGHRLLIPRDTIKEYPKSYDLFHWRNAYFSVYNCFELADISDRGLFKSKVDFIVAAEFNRDTAYFSDIAGSWVRDVHCYFIQVNTSHYGDSRLIQPAKSYVKDLIQIKGGLNSTVLVGELKIEKLREFQLVEYNLQKEEIMAGRTELKPTPPDFNRDNVKIRIDGGSFTKSNNNAV